MSPVYYNRKKRCLGVYGDLNLCDRIFDLRLQSMLLVKGYLCRKPFDLNVNFQKLYFCCQISIFKLVFISHLSDYRNCHPAIIRAYLRVTYNFQINFPAYVALLCVNNQQQFYNMYTLSCRIYHFRSTVVQRKRFVL